MVKKGTVMTPHADYCLPGITRATVSYICQLERKKFNKQIQMFLNTHSHHVYTC